MGLDAQRNLYMTYPAIEAILNYRENSAREKLASKKLKALYQNNSQLVKTSVRIVNKPNGFKIPDNGKVNAVPYGGFLQLVNFEVIQQNPVAINLVVAGLGDSLRSLAYSHFGIAISDEQRNQWLSTRHDGKMVRRDLTDAIKSYLERHKECSDNYRIFIYVNATDAMYRAVFGMTAKQMEEMLGCTRHESRDYLDSRSLNRINNAEAACVAQIDNRDVEPMQAVKNVVDFLCLTPSQPVSKIEVVA
ncbi:hypothetical protein FNW02_36180 [Komarekiella sp. 'clone 1']|uniref:Uncharacterized protein n=1 Tax=Komarekiella delphini-convector SJRDD-AB1 TaxID=2593771 RepID=A0AA40VVF2_9NOST|nr:hypothetical protein [Komarekiella delphini-convector]MBD6621021.1 hypothetical protein [Komarekiella delphini-convector SJRDD-AB1]